MRQQVDATEAEAKRKAIAAIIARSLTTASIHGIPRRDLPLPRGS